jgi:hypothetical protein
MGPMDRMLMAVFLVAVALYLWIAGTSTPLGFSAGPSDPYNQLASAFLHFHLDVGRAPSELLRLSNPYNPAENNSIQIRYGLHDYALYHEHLYLTWGPAPVVAGLLPFHLLGLEPSPSLTAAVYAISGFGFSLATLRVILRQIKSETLWIAALAALVLMLSSAVPFMLRRPAVYEEAIIGGYCFAMAGIWLATSAVVKRAAGMWRLVIMSLCFGFAGGSRPTLWLTGLILVPVFFRLRGTRPATKLAAGLLIPVCGCFLLILAYNQARFGKPLEVGSNYVLAGFEPREEHYGKLGYLLPGAWFYALSPPRPTIQFPFIAFSPHPVSYPGRLPSGYFTEEPTGGLLYTTPIIFFLVALPWLQRYRRKLLGSVGAPLLLVAGAGGGILLFLSYEIFSTTERYEGDFATLLLFGALAAWLALSEHLRGRRRWIVRTGGALLAVWGCVVGLAVSFTGYNNLLEMNHPGTWSTLEKLTSPISDLLAKAEDHPVIVSVTAPHLNPVTHKGYTSLGVTGIGGSLFIGDRAEILIGSPDGRMATLLLSAARATGVAGEARLGAGASGLLLEPSGRPKRVYQVPPRGGLVRIPVELHEGVNRMALSAVGPLQGTAIPVSEQLVYIQKMSLGR